MNQFFYDKFGKIKVEGLNSKLFWLGLILKLVLAANFASSYLRELFAPFLNYYIGSAFSNPYQYFYELGKLDTFPYPTLMLWIMSSLRAVSQYFIAINTELVTSTDLFIYRLPLLIADLCILLVLLRWLKTQSKKVLIYYWLSPILIYISYIHGQLDAIPIALLFASMYFLFKEKYSCSAIVLALSAASKTHILMLIPFFFFYALKNKVRLSELARASIGFILVYLAANLPYLNSKAYLAMVFNNSQQMKIFDAVIKLGADNYFYLIPALYIALIAKSYSVRTYNRDIFIMFLGFSFGILTLFIPPMPGWYFWITPFFIYFFIKEKNAPLYFLVLNIAYFLYFLVDIALINKLSFTILQTSLLINCLWIYHNGIKSNLQYKIKSEPYLIGIGGDSGAGKTTYSNLLRDVFSEKNTTVIRGDDMHKYERGDEMWQIYTHLNPKANDLHDEMQQALELKQGKGISRRQYDHSIGKFTLPKQIKSNRVIILEGLLPYYLARMRAIYDLKVFIQPEEALRLDWKLNRDTGKRGHNETQVLQQIKDREEDSLKYIQSQEQHADISIKFKVSDKDPKQLKLRLEFSNDIHLDRLLKMLASRAELEISHDYNNDKQILEIEGKIDKAYIEYAAYELIDELDEIVQDQAKWHSDYDGLLQLFSIYYIFAKMRIDLKTNV
jgi:uridine kinase